MYSLIRLININKIIGKIISILQTEIIIFISILSPPPGVLTDISFLIGKNKKSSNETTIY